MTNTLKDNLIMAQTEANRILIDCQNKYAFSDIRVKVKHLRRGHSRYKTRLTSIPLWAYGKGEAFFTYYVLHEISHIINYDTEGSERGHSEDFKQIEKTLLKDYGLIPIYKRAYIKALKDINGVIRYKEHNV